LTILLAKLIVVCELSIVVADIDGPIPSTETEEAPAVIEDPLTVEQIQVLTCIKNE